MGRLRSWIASRLWRRLIVSQMLVIFLIMLVLQLLLAGAVTLMVRSTRPIPSDAGLWARAFATTAGWLMENGRGTDVTLALEMVQQQAISLPETDGVQPADWNGRLLGVTVLLPDGTVLAQSGEPLAPTSYQAERDTLLAQALTGESDPVRLSRWLTRAESGRILGAAPIMANNQVQGVVLVEMYPSLRLATAPTPLVGFAGTILTSSLLGLPLLLLAAALAFVAALVTARSLGTRLQELETTAQAMAAGDLTRRVADAAPDEIGQLGQAFNKMGMQLADSLTAVAAEKEKVETLLAARQALVANISHDLRTPIASVAAHLETLATRPERLETYLPIVQQETARLSRLVADLFALAQLDVRELTIDLMPVELGSLIGDAVTGYRELAWARRRIVLETAAAPDLPPVQADPQRVTQILDNLINNALRYTPEGGVVSITAARAGDCVEVRVQDTGIGIPEAELARIFDRFYRGDRARTPPDDSFGHGSGLGLAIVKGLVEAMGGTVTAVSRPGAGTTILFRLKIGEC